MNKKSRIVGFRTTRELYSRIAGEAQSRNIPVSWFLRSLLTEYLKKEDISKVVIP